MACVLQAACSALKLVDVTLWRVIKKKRKEGSLEACLMAGRGGVLQANSVLTDYKAFQSFLGWDTQKCGDAAILSAHPDRLAFRRCPIQHLNRYL